MTTTTVGKLQFNPKSAWVSGTAYVVDDIVTYKNKFYVCTVANSSATTPDLNTSQFSVIGGGTYFVGEWSSATTYAVGDIVTYTKTSAYNTRYNYSEKSTYICILAGSNQNPSTATTYWKLLAQGNGRDRYVFHGAPNEGYIPDYKATWDAYALSTTVGMGDSWGEFKTPGTHMVGINGVCYINKRYGLIFQGNNENVHTGNGGTQGSHCSAPNEAPFQNLSWYDGSLPTSPTTQKPRVIQVETDHWYCSLVLFDNGEVHYAGYNGHGQRGDGTTDGLNMFTQCGYANVNRAAATTVLRTKKVIRIASTAGGSTSNAVANYALVRNADDSRELYAWGYNGYGQLGQGNTTNYYAPTLVSFDQVTNGKIIEIWATGGEYGCMWFLTDQGKMYAMGYNGNGQLGVNDQSNRSSPTLVKAWGTGASNKIRKFNTCGGSSAPSMLVVRGDSTLWTWGYNGYGQLGHGHTYNVTFPQQVYTTGYTSPANPVTTSGQGTPTGTALTDVWNAWMCGGNGYNYMYVARGTSDSSNTAYACGYNGYYNLSSTANDSPSTVSTLQGVYMLNNVALTNLSDVTSNQGHSSSYISHAVRRSNGDWYFGAYNNGAYPIGHFDSYNQRQDQDPNGLSGNYRLKNNVYWPKQRSDRSQYKYILGGYSSNKWGMLQDLKTGEIHMCSYGNDYYLFNTYTGSGLATLQKLHYT
jgi:hypothetical protein